MHYLNEQNIFIFLLQVFVLLLLAKTSGEIFRRFNQPSITAEILVGVLLGPTLLGRFFPEIQDFMFPADPIQQNMLETVAWFGILFFLLKTGLEMDFSSAWRQKSDAMAISITDVIIPMIIAFFPCLFLPDKYMGDPAQRVLFCLFIATIMTISALPVTARILQDLSLYKTDLGYLIMCALSLNDIIGWLVFTVVLGFVTQSGIQLRQFILILIFTIAFTVLCFTAGRRFTNYIIVKMHEKKMPEPGSSLTFVSLLGILCGGVTLKIGIHALFGFFIAGIMAGESHALSARTRNVISQMVHSIFIPLFFATIGLKIDFFENFDLFLVSFMLFIGIAGRFIGAWIGVGLTNQPGSNRFLISLAHIPGGEMQIVVGILALEYGLVTETVFVAIVFGAVVSSMVLGPCMNYAFKKRKEVSLEEFFLRRAILPELKSSNPADAVRELCKSIASQEHMPDEDLIYTAVIERENRMGTAIEEGCAIPHANIELLRRPVIAFGRSVGGIDWDSPDGKLSRFIFLILTPAADKESQISILRAISVAMSKENLRQDLIKAENYNRIWRILHDEIAAHKVVKNL